MNIMIHIPIELKQKVMSYLPILNDNQKLINNIIKNYKTYFIKSLLHEYSKYFDDTYYITKYIIMWPHINEILSRVRVSELNDFSSKDLLIQIFNECTLKETQYLYLFTTLCFQSPIF